MDSLVHDEIRFLTEALFTLDTFEGFFPGMCQTMSLKVSFFTEVQFTLVTFERLLAGMRQTMFRKV